MYGVVYLIWGGAYQFEHSYDIYKTQSRTMLFYSHQFECEQAIKFHWSTFQIATMIVSLLLLLRQQNCGYIYIYSESNIK